MEEQLKYCPGCKVEKPLSDFHKGNGKFGRRSRCKDCAKEYETPERKQRRIDAEKEKRQSPEYRDRQNELERLRRRKSIEKSLLIAARYRAKQKGIEFNIEIDDIIIPEFCPLLNIPLAVAEGVATSNSFSLDRKNNSKGYIKGNVWVISKRANALKGDASVNELDLLVFNLKKNGIH